MIKTAIFPRVRIFRMMFIRQDLPPLLKNDHSILFPFLFTTKQKSPLLKKVDLSVYP